jgi:hypothetical protein
MSRHELQGGTTVALLEAPETRTGRPTTRPWRARALAVIAAVLIPGLAATAPGVG